MLGVPSFSRSRRHCPMHGPHAFASTMASISWSAPICPSRSIVARTCSEPGVTINSVAAETPRPDACRATSAARDMSS